MPRHSIQNPPCCPYCGKQGELVTGDKLYRLKYLADKLFWRCEPCDAHVGCHANSGARAVPFGRMANAKVRAARQAAHAVFDPIWQRRQSLQGGGKTQHRQAAYEWLAKQMGVKYEHCHISWFDETECQRVVEICTPYAGVQK